MYWENFGDVCAQSCPGYPLNKGNPTVKQETARELLFRIRQWHEELFTVPREAADVQEIIAEEISVELDEKRKLFSPEIQDLAISAIMHHYVKRAPELIGVSE